MSNSSRTQVRKLKEVTWSITPASAMDDINVTSESLGQETSVQNSEFIRSDTNVADVVRTAITTTGDLGIELQYLGYDEFIEGALRGAFLTEVNMSETTIAADASGFTDSGSGFVSSNIVVGQFIRVAGFTDTTINTWYRIVTVTAGDLATLPLPAGTEAAGNTIIIKGALLKNGIVDQSWTLEKEFSDITQFVSFTGMRVGAMVLNIAPGSIINGNFSFQGKEATSAQATVGTGGPNAASTNPVMNAVDNISLIRIDDVLSTDDFTEISLNISTNLRDQPAIANLANINIGSGSIDVTGTTSVYLADATLYEKYLAFTDFSLSFVAEDSDGNGYAFFFPACNFTAGNPEAGGINQDVLLPLQFTAKFDSTFGGTIGITRVTA